MTDIKAEIKNLVDALYAAIRGYHRLALDEDSPSKLGAPCSAKQLAALEHTLGKPLPPSYRAFLELHNGWTHFDGNACLLSVEDQTSDWVKSRVDDFGTLFAEDDVPSPFDEGARPLMMGEDEHNYVVLDPRKPNAQGEMLFMAYDYVRKERQFKGFGAYLSHVLKIRRKLVEKEKAG